MTAEISGERQRGRRRRHFKGYRRLKVVLLALGIAGLVLGVMLICWYGLRGNGKLFNIGVIYILASIVVLGLRGIIDYLGQASKD